MMHYIVKKKKKNMELTLRILVTISDAVNYLDIIFALFILFILMKVISRYFRRIDKRSHRTLPVTKDNSGNCLSRKITNGALWSEPALFQHLFMRQKNYDIMTKFLVFFRFIHFQYILYIKITRIIRKRKYIEFLIILKYDVNIMLNKIMLNKNFVLYMQCFSFSFFIIKNIFNIVIILL